MDEATSRQLKSVGDITLSLAFINSATKRNVSREPAQPVEYMAPETLPMLGEVSEKSLKGDARSHQARLVPQFCLIFLILTLHHSLDVPVALGPYTPSCNGTT